MSKKNQVRLISTGVWILVIVVIVMSLLFIDIKKDDVIDSVEQYQMVLNGKETSKSYVDENFSNTLDEFIEDNEYDEVEEYFVDSYLENIDLRYVSHEVKDGKILVKVSVNSIYIDSWKSEFVFSIEEYLSPETISIIINTTEINQAAREEAIDEYWTAYSNFLSNHAYVDKEIEIELDKNYEMSEEQFDKLVKEVFNS